MATYFGRDGAQYVLEKKPIGGGGEAEIFKVSGNAGIVAKIYKKNVVSTAIEEKLKIMVTDPPKCGSELAWPIDLLYGKSKNGKSNIFVGYVMPFANATSNLREAYVIDNRKNVPWNVFVRIARNLSAVIYNIHEPEDIVGGIHEKKYVVGDLNPENILVNSNTQTVTIVDTDSFHIKDSKKGVLYRCLVAKPEFIAPELRGVDFKKYPKTFTEYSDRYSLAIIIFSILINGAHPFSCSIYNDKIGERYQQDKNMENGVCVYFPDTVRDKGDIGIPKYSPGINWLPDDLKQLFYRAFVEGHYHPSKRPKPEEWYECLRKLEKTLTRCSVNKNHIYPISAASCPWCPKVKKSNSTHQGASNSSSSSNTSTSNTKVRKYPSSISKTAKTYIYWEEFLNKRGITTSSVINSYINNTPSNSNKSAKKNQTGVASQQQSGTNFSRYSYTQAYTQPASTPTKYAIKYYIDGKLVNQDHFDEGEMVFIRKPFNKNNLIISPWKENGKVITQAFLMPNHDVELRATSSKPVQYALRYYVDGKLSGGIEYYYPGDLVQVRPIFKINGKITTDWKDGSTVAPSQFKMPNHDVELRSTSKKLYQYALRYYVDGKLSGDIEYYYPGDRIQVRSPPIINGKKSPMWKDGFKVVSSPFTMPNYAVRFDTTTNYTSTDLKHAVEYYVDGSIHARHLYSKGELVTILPLPHTWNGYTISKWEIDGNDAVNFIMPDKDVRITAKSTKSTQYSLRYYIDDKISGDIEYYLPGDIVTIRPRPIVNGKETSDWKDGSVVASSPYTMPNHDVELRSTSKKLYQYALRYYVDGKLSGDIEYYYPGDTIQVRSPPIINGKKSPMWKDGFRFVSSPFTMPNYAVRFDTTTDLKRAVEYYVDGSIVGRDLYSIGELVTIRPAYTKNGYTVSKWNNGGNDATNFIMPDKDVIITATSTKSTQYSLRYYIDDKLSGDIEYYFPGDIVTIRPRSIVNGKETLEWKDRGVVASSPYTMPNRDVELRSKTRDTREYSLQYEVNGKQYGPIEKYKEGDPVNIRRSLRTYSSTKPKWMINGNEVAGTIIMPNHNVVVYARVNVPYKPYEDNQKNKNYLFPKSVTNNKSNITHSVTYKLNGNEIAKKEYQVGDLVNIQGFYQSYGFITTRWKLDGFVIGSSFYMPRQDVVVSADLIRKNKFFVEYYVDGNIVGREKYQRGELVTIRPQYTKKGYIVSKWKIDGNDAVNFIMSDDDVKINATSIKSSEYCLKYYIDGRLSGDIEYYFPGDLVTIRSPPIVNGRDAPEWKYENKEISNPFIMPDHAVRFDTTTNTPSTNAKRAVEYYVDGSIVGRELYLAGESVTIRPPYVKKGYTLSKWEIDGNNATNFIMPDKDVIITATSTRIVEYSLRYYVDGKLSGDAEYYLPGVIVPIRPLPIVNGKEAPEWKDGSNVVSSPFIMPSHAVRFDTDTTVIEKSPVTSTRIVEYSLRYYIDGKLSGDAEYYLPGVIVPIRPLPIVNGKEAPEWKDGSNVVSSPFIMPSHAVRFDTDTTVIEKSPVTSTKSSEYALMYYVDGRLSGDIEYYLPGAIVPIRPRSIVNGKEAPEWKDGSKIVSSPFIMPNHSVRFDADTNLNKMERFCVEYYVDGKSVGRELYHQGELVRIRSVYYRKGYSVSKWKINGNVAVDFNMPENDVKITADIEPIKHSLIYIVDGKQIGDTEYYACGDSVNVRLRYNVDGKEAPPWKDGNSIVSSPFSMPDHDVILETDSSSLSEKHAVEYIVDGSIVGRELYRAGELVNIRPVYVKKGYTVSKWKNNESNAFDFYMPEYDVRITAESSEESDSKNPITTTSSRTNEPVIVENDNNSDESKQVLIENSKVNKINSKKLMIILAICLAIIAVCIIFILIR